MSTRQEIIDALRTIGNGDIEQGKALVVTLADRLTHARTKHPVFAVGMTEACITIYDEIGEVATAIADETPKRVQDELLDVLATSVRMYNHEYESAASTEEAWS